MPPMPDVMVFLAEFVSGEAFASVVIVMV